MLYLIEREYYFSKMRRTKQNQDFVVYLKYIKWAARLFVRPDKHFTKLHWGFHEVPSGNCAILQVYLSTWQVIFICFFVEQCSSESVLNNPEGIEKGRTVLLKLFFFSVLLIKSVTTMFPLFSLKAVRIFVAKINHSATRLSSVPWQISARTQQFITPASN